MYSIRSTPDLLDGHGRRKGGAADSQILHFPIKFLAKRIVFLVSRGKNEIPRLLGHWKFFWLSLEKSTIAPPGKNPTDAHVGVYSKLAHQKQLRKALTYSLFYFRLVITSAYMQLWISLSPTSTRSLNFRQRSAMA